MATMVRRHQTSNFFFFFPPIPNFGFGPGWAAKSFLFSALFGHSLVVVMVSDPWKQVVGGLPRALSRGNRLLSHRYSDSRTFLDVQSNAHASSYSLLGCAVWELLCATGRSVMHLHDQDFSVVSDNTSQTLASQRHRIDQCDV